MHKEPKYFPLFMNLEKKKILMIGGGTIAYRRVKILTGFYPEIVVVAPEITEEFEAYCIKYQIQYRKEFFKENMLDELEKYDYVLTAIDDKVTDQMIYTACREKKILVNIASKKEWSDFYFPAVIEKDGIIIGMTASGKAHGLLKRTADRIRDFLDGGIEC